MLRIVCDRCGTDVEPKEEAHYVFTIAPSNDHAEVPSLRGDLCGYCANVLRQTATSKEQERLLARLRRSKAS